MPRIALVYTTTTGNTQYVAETFRGILKDQAELFPLIDRDLKTLVEYDAFVLCVSTWGRSDMQDDWETHIKAFETLPLGGKKCGIIGLGDQKNYPDAFADGVKKLADVVRRMGMVLVGTTSSDGYSFNQSKALEGGRFLGCIIDEDNQHDQTEPRLRAWANIIKREFKS